jgi:hypothetical protein
MGDALVAQNARDCVAAGTQDTAHIPAHTRAATVFDCEGDGSMQTAFNRAQEIKHGLWSSRLVGCHYKSSQCHNRFRASAGWDSYACDARVNTQDATPSINHGT